LGLEIGGDLSFWILQILKIGEENHTLSISLEAGERFNIRASSLSIAHDGGFAVAVVAIEF